MPSFPVASSMTSATLRRQGESLLLARPGLQAIGRATSVLPPILLQNSWLLVI